LLEILGGVALLLWGVARVRNGITRAYGAGLRNFIENATSNRVKAFFAGVGVTGLLQSSTATALIVASFAQKGLINSSAGFGVMLGADVGTTMVAQLLSLDLKWLAPVMLMLGVFMYGRAQTSKVKHLSSAIVGLGLMLVALGIVVNASAPMRESTVLPVLFQPLENEPALAILIAAIMTWLAHSSLAMVLLFMSLTVSGVLSVPLGLILVLGANVGGGIAPIVATMKHGAKGCRVPVGNLIMRVSGALIALFLLDYVQPYLEQFDPDPARQIVNFHTAFNVVLAIIFLPFVGPLADMCKAILPERPVFDDQSRPRYLDEDALDTPSAALTGVSREATRIGNIVENMLRETIVVFRNNDERLLNHIQEQDDLVDDLYEAVKLYMARISSSALDPEEGVRYIKILTFATNLEHIGDIIDKNLLELANKKIRNKNEFSNAGLDEIERFHALVLENMHLCLQLFMTNDADLARRLVRHKTTLREYEVTASMEHMDRMRAGKKETLATNDLHLDILRDLKRINSHLTQLAYSVLEEQGELYDTRLKEIDKIDKIAEIAELEKAMDEADKKSRSDKKKKKKSNKS